MRPVRGISETLRQSDHPVCAAAVASHLFLMAQPPLLIQEANCQPHIHSELLWPWLQLTNFWISLSDSGIWGVGVEL